MPVFDVPCDDQHTVPDQEGVFVVPETTRVERPGIAWQFARTDARIELERPATPSVKRPMDVLQVEHPAERLEFEGGTP